MSEDALPPLREVIARHGLAAKKALGQNFLFDLNLTRHIARAAAPLDGGTVIFANGITISPNATLAGCGTLTGNVTVLAGGSNGFQPCGQEGAGPELSL